MTEQSYNTPADLMDDLGRDFVCLRAQDIETAERCEKPNWMLADMAFCFWLESKIDRAGPRAKSDGGSRLDIDGVEVDVRWSKNPTHLVTFQSARLADILVLAGAYSFDRQMYVLLGYARREDHVRRQAETLQMRGAEYVVKRTPVAELTPMREFSFELIG